MMMNIALQNFLPYFKYWMQPTSLAGILHIGYRPIVPVTSSSPYCVWLPSRGRDGGLLFATYWSEVAAYDVFILLICL